MRKKRTEKLTDQLRRIIDESGQTRYRIAKAIGMDQSAMAKFYSGQRGISAKALDRLGEYLRLKIIREEKQ